MLPTFFVINPRSGNGNLRKLIPLIRTRFESGGIPFDIHITQSPGDATRAARQASERFPVVVAVGGDGTVNEVVNGLVESAGMLGVLPVGSGNDFSKAIGLPGRLADCLEIIAVHKQKTIDLGYISAVTSSMEKKSAHFINSAGIGLDALVAHEARKISWIRGVGKYAVAASRVLFRFTPGDSTLRSEEFASSGSHLLISVGNGQSSGGGFYLTPDALLDDGLFDVCVAKDVSLIDILKIFPFVFAGKHVRFRQISMNRTKRLVVKSESNLPAHMDGEILGLDLREVEVKIIPGGMKVIVP